MHFHLHLPIMKNKLTYFLGFALVFFSLVTCKHKCEKDETNTDGCVGCCEEQNLSSMLEYYYYKVGSYWIYEEQNSGDKDTVIVTYSDSGISAANNSYWSFYASSTYYGAEYRYEFNDSFSTYCIARPNCQCRQVKRSKLIPLEYSSEERIFIFPLIQGNLTHTNSGTSQITSYLDSITINNTIYENVFVNHVDVCATEDINYQNWDDGVEVEFYFCKHFFIIRKDLPSYNQSWKLVECNILQ
jgi:hypothetical protein